MSGNQDLDQTTGGKGKQSDEAKNRVLAEMLRGTELAVKQHRLENEQKLIDLELHRTETLVKAQEAVLRREEISVKVRELEYSNFERQVENNINHEKLLLQIMRQVIRQSKLIAGILGLIAGHLKVDPQEMKRVMLTSSAWPGGDDETNSDSGAST